MNLFYVDSVVTTEFKIVARYKDVVILEHLSAQQVVQWYRDATDKDNYKDTLSVSQGSFFKEPTKRWYCPFAIAEKTRKKKLKAQMSPL